MSNRVIIQNAVKRYGDFTALNGVSLDIQEGEFFTLLGPSGCGKSTTLNMICGLEKPTSGRILFGDDDVTSFPPERRGVGMVFQNYALYPHLTVKQNILFPLQNLKGKDKLSRSQMDEWLRMQPVWCRLQSLWTDVLPSSPAVSSSA